MGYASAEQVIRERFAANWPDQFSPAIAYTFEDQGEGEFPARDAPWVRLSVLHGEATQVEFGMTRRYRRPGIVVVQVFTPVGSGTGQVAEIADAVRDIYEGRTINGVVFKTTSLTRVGIDGPWLQHNVNTVFHADELR